MMKETQNIKSKALLAILMSIILTLTLTLPAYAGGFGDGSGAGGSGSGGSGNGGSGGGGGNSGGGGGSGSGGGGGNGSGSGGSGTNPGGGGGKPSWCQNGVKDDNENLYFCRITVSTLGMWGGPGGGCPARQGPGAFGGANIGFLQRNVSYFAFIQTAGGSTVPLNATTISTTIDCYYAESWDDVTLYCVDSSVVNINMVAPGRKSMGSARKSTAFAGNRTIPNCLSSGQYLSLYVDINQFGRFLAQAQTVGRTCTARYYRSSNDQTGARPADYIVSCGGQYVMDSSEDKLQIDCVNGVTRGWTNPQEYTAQACLDQSLSKARCDVGRSPLFNDTARRENVEAFRDGKKNTIEWDRARIVGDNVVSQSVTNTRLSRSGTPWNTKASATSDRQLAYVENNGKNALNTNLSGSVNKFDAGFYQASDSGSKFRLQPTYTHNVTLRTEFARVTGYKPFGSLDYETYQGTIDTTGSCVSRPINIDVLRSVNG